MGKFTIPSVLETKNSLRSLNTAKGLKNTFLLLFFCICMLSVDFLSAQNDVNIRNFSNKRVDLDLRIHKLLIQETVLSLPTLGSSRRTVGCGDSMVLHDFAITIFNATYKNWRQTNLKTVVPRHIKSHSLENKLLKIAQKTEYIYIV